MWDDRSAGPQAIREHRSIGAQAYRHQSDSKTGDDAGDDADEE